MNRTVKYAYQWIDSMKGKTKARTYASIFEGRGYEEFCREHGSKVEDKGALATAYLKKICWERFATTTVSGRRQAKEAAVGIDRLKPVSVWMPSGQFGPSRLGSYTPLGKSVVCTEITKPFKLKEQQLKTRAAWKEFSRFARSLPVGDGEEWIRPWLDYDPHLNSEQDVYFILDKSNGVVKIGISKDIPNRLEAIKRQYNTGELELISVVAGGGRTVEAGLHRRFRRYLISEDGKGREWFKASDKLMGFIEDLNTYAFKSDFLIREKIVKTET